MAQDNSKKAFPGQEIVQTQVAGIWQGEKLIQHPGMTLREHYAGLIMAQMIARHGSPTSTPVYPALADYSVQAADALIVALEKK